MSTSMHNMFLTMRKVDDDLWLLLHRNRHFNSPRHAPLPLFTYYTSLFLSSSLYSVDDDEYEEEDDDKVFGDVGDDQ